MRRLMMIMFSFLGLMAAPAGAQVPAMSSADNAYQFSFTGIDGAPMPLSAYAGRAILIVNTASQCGFTGQYKGLEALYQTYKDRGLTVIGVPCNDFGGQEPGSLEDIKAFTEKQYGVTFPLTQKYDVKGENIHPFYTWAAKQETDALFFTKPRWNFHKYLIAPDGHLAGSFGSNVEPDSKELITAIEANLPPAK